MRTEVIKTNSYFKTVNQSDINELLSKIVLSDRQKEIFTMYYIRKLNVGYIADSLNFSYSVVKRELHGIREKINKIYLD